MEQYKLVLEGSKQLKWETGEIIPYRMMKLSLKQSQVQ